MNEPSVRVTFAIPFQKAVKRLREKYPHIHEDMQPLVEQLQSAQTPGDQLQETGYMVYKAPVANQDAQRGKSGGYRVIDYLRTPTHIILLTIYTKSERADINSDEIQSNG